MNITLNADEIKTIIAVYFSIPQEDIRVGTIEIKKNMRVDYEPMAVIKDCDMSGIDIAKK